MEGPCNPKDPAWTLDHNSPVHLGHVAKMCCDVKFVSYVNIDEVGFEVYVLVWREAWSTHEFGGNKRLSGG